MFENHLCSHSMVLFLFFSLHDILILLWGTRSLFRPFGAHSYNMGYSDNDRLQFLLTLNILWLLWLLSRSFLHFSKPGIFVFRMLFVPNALEDVFGHVLLFIRLVQRVNLDCSILFNVAFEAILL